MLATKLINEFYFQYKNDSAIEAPTQKYRSKNSQVKQNKNKMKQNKIVGSSIPAAITFILVILATGANNEVITNAKISKNMNSGINDGIASLKYELHESLSTIISEMKQNVAMIRDEINEVQQSVATIKNEMQKTISNKDESQRNIPSTFDQRQENSQFPTTCAEALLSGSGRSEIHQLYLNDYNIRPFEVQCLKDPKNGPAWTIIQRRQDNTTNFYRDWSEYQTGFGDLKTNYFIGLERLHLMTLAQPHELWIQLEDFQGESRYAKYSSFAIGDEYSLYELITLGTYVGNAGNSLSYSRGAKFSTKDNDNDGTVGNCAVGYKGAWWYLNCTNSNLNGKYQNGITATYDGIFWQHWRGDSYSYKYVHMAIRPKK